MKKYIISAVLLLLLCSSAWSQTISGYLKHIDGTNASRGCVELQYYNENEKQWEIKARTCVNVNGYFSFTVNDTGSYYLYGYGAGCTSEYGENGPFPVSSPWTYKEIHANRYRLKPYWCLRGCCTETFSPPEENDNE